MSLAEIAAHVERLDREFAAAREAGAAFWRTTIEQAIPPSLGVVVVDAGGTLREVRLSRAGLRVTDPATVGEKILHAVRGAEARAEHARRWREP